MEKKFKVKSTAPNQPHKVAQCVLSNLTA
uniref:Uncharacterized protein n=1 Tax=Anguilla anguilla TaxID=7936 RepID=A0A0E9PNP2_ANGAN